MKKSIKIAAIVLLIAAAAAGTAFYMTMPTPVRMTEIQAGTAELSFTEQGIVTAENTVMVFPVTQGEINGLYVREGQQVRAGDPIASVTHDTLIAQLNQVHSGIRSLEAQIANVDVEDAAMRQNLTASRNSLQGELRSINAQATQADRAFTDHTEALTEQLRIQQVLIDQHQSELSRVRENFERVEVLHNSGVATLSEFEAASASLTAAQTQLETAQGQYAVIAAGAGQSGTAHFEGIRASINAQISGITQQLAQDTTGAARAHLEALKEIEESRAWQLMLEIENTTITAPVDGIITTLHAANTNIIAPTAPVAEITVPGSLSVDVFVSTQDINSIREGDTVRHTLRQRMGDTYCYGTITEIENTAVVRMTALGVEERKVNVRTAPSIVEPLIGIGYAVDVTFYLFREENRITVPRTAVFRRGGQDFVWAVRGGSEGTVQAVPITTGLELRTDIVIESGLNIGDFVVNDANNPALSDGARVTNEH